MKVSSAQLSLWPLAPALWVLLVANQSLCAQEVPAGPRQKAVAAPLLPPMPPVPISFREFLVMNPAERAKVLATRTPDQRRVLESSLREYESLSPGAREARLRNLGLRLYLRPLLGISVSNRLEWLERVPQPDRKLVEERLQFWDRLLPEAQREFLTNDWVLGYITSPPNQDTVYMPTSVVSRIETGINRWNQLPAQTREEILQNFEQLFKVPETEKAKILDEFSYAERQRIQKTLQTFAGWPKAQRDQCIRGFQKFAELSLEERERFLSNVWLWQSMSAKDRQAWQALVSRMSIPTPPLPHPPTPPLPGPFPKPQLVVTNGPS